MAIPVFLYPIKAQIPQLRSLHHRSGTASCAHTRRDVTACSRHLARSFRGVASPAADMLSRCGYSVVGTKSPGITGKGPSNLSRDRRGRQDFICTRKILVQTWRGTPPTIFRFAASFKRKKRTLIHVRFRSPWEARTAARCSGPENWHFYQSRPGNTGEALSRSSD